MHTYEWLSVIVVLAHIARCSSIRFIKDGSCISGLDGTNSFELVCNNGIIAHIDVDGGKGNCNAYDCLGKTPRMIEDAFNCYWQSKCNITLNNEIMVLQREPVNGFQCYGRQSDFLRLNNYMCLEIDSKTTNTDMTSLPKDRIIDICSNNSAVKRGMAFKSGILRSHKLYPWQYNVNPSNNECEKILVTRSNAILHIHVKDVDLGEDDQLLLYSGSDVTDLEANPTTSVTDFVTTNVRFVFKVSRYSNGARGFVLCYIFLEEGHVSYGNACDMVMTLGVIGTPTYVSDQPSFPAIISKKATTAPVVKPAAVPVPEKCEKGKKGKACRKRNKKLNKGKNKNNRTNKKDKKDRKKKKGKRNKKSTAD